MRPIIIIGGFMSVASVYNGMRWSLQQMNDAEVCVVDTQPVDWIFSASKSGAMRVLDKLDRLVDQALNGLNGRKVILIGHSIGGVLARLYLSDKPFGGRIYNGCELVSHLITLGSPHINQGGLMRGGQTSRWVEEIVPGAMFYDQVRYTSIAGKWIAGTQFGPRLSRWVYGIYDEICGDGTAWGDGIVPVQSAILPGSQALILEGVSHYSFGSDPWYGSPEVIPRWWNPIDLGVE